MESETKLGTREDNDGDDGDCNNPQCQQEELQYESLTRLLFQSGNFPLFGDDESHYGLEDDDTSIRFRHHRRRHVYVALLRKISKIARKACRITRRIIEDCPLFPKSYDSGCAIIWGCLGILFLGTLLGISFPTETTSIADVVALPPWYHQWTTLSNIVGYSYFASWTLSFYPQIVSNFRHPQKSVGLSVDFVVWNILGFMCYSIYVTCFLFSSHIRMEYAQRFDDQQEGGDHDGEERAPISNITHNVTDTVSSTIANTLVRSISATIGISSFSTLPQNPTEILFTSLSLLSFSGISGSDSHSRSNHDLAINNNFYYHDVTITSMMKDDDYLDGQDDDKNNSQDDDRNDNQDDNQNNNQDDSQNNSQDDDQNNNQDDDQNNNQDENQDNSQNDMLTAVPQVKMNDVAFAWHALLLSIVVLLQIVYYDSIHDNEKDKPIQCDESEYGQFDDDDDCHHGYNCNDSANCGGNSGVKHHDYDDHDDSSDNCRENDREVNDNFNQQFGNSSFDQHDNDFNKVILDEYDSARCEIDHGNNTPTHRFCHDWDNDHDHIHPNILSNEVSDNDMSKLLVGVVGDIKMPFSPGASNNKNNKNGNKNGNINRTNNNNGNSFVPGMLMMGCGGGSPIPNKEKDVNQYHHLYNSTILHSDHELHADELRFNDSSSSYKMFESSPKGCDNQHHHYPLDHPLNNHDIFCNPLVKSSPTQSTQSLSQPSSSTSPCSSSSIVSHQQTTHLKLPPNLTTATTTIGFESLKSMTASNHEHHSLSSTSSSSSSLIMKGGSKCHDSDNHDDAGSCHRNYDPDYLHQNRFHVHWTQRISHITKLSLSIILSSCLFGAILVAYHESHNDDDDYWNLQWIDYLYMLSFIKVGISIVKYVPQVTLNMRRKSTSGWQIWNVLLDFLGGLLSLFQLVGDSYAQAQLRSDDSSEWIVGIIGNPAKFGLGFVSIFFDIIFMLQHYVLYRHPPKQQELCLEHGGAACDDNSRLDAEQEEYYDADDILQNSQYSYTHFQNECMSIENKENGYQKPLLNQYNGRVDEVLV